MAFIERRAWKDRTGQERRSYRVRHWDGAKNASRSFKYRDDAKAFVRNLESAKARGDRFDPDAGREKLTTYAEKWKGTLSNRKPKTRAGYETLLKTHVLPSLGTRSLRDLEPSDVEGWVSKLSQTLSPSRVRQSYFVLSSIMRMAVRDGRISTSPCRDVALPKMNDADIRVPTPEEVETLVGRMGTHADRLLTRVLAYCGLRWGEVAGLRRRHIDLLRRSLRIVETVSEVDGVLYERQPTKTRRVRTVPIPKGLVEDFARHLGVVPSDPDAYLFQSAKGGAVRYSAFKYRWDGANNLGIRVHDLRHFAASVMLQRGVSVVTVSELLGHSSPTVTLKVYAHVFDEDRMKAADVMDQVLAEQHSQSAPIAEQVVAALR